MRTTALTGLVAVLAAGCGELPSAPAATPVDAAAAVSPPAAPDALLLVPRERISELTASLGDARGRVLPSLANRDALDHALAQLGQALDGGSSAQAVASAQAALAALDAAAGEQPDAAAELDAIRLALDEVLASVQPQATAQ